MREWRPAHRTRRDGTGSGLGVGSQGRRILARAVALVALAAAPEARAESGRVAGSVLDGRGPAPSPSPAPLPSPAPSPRWREAAGPLELSWSYRRFGGWDAVASVAGAAIILTDVWVGPVDEPRWEGGILFDDPVRDALRGRSRSARDSARTVGDVLFRTGAVLPTLVDGLLVTLALRRAPDVAAQMILINLEAYAVTGAVLITSETFVGRARPSAGPCKLDPEYEAFCGKPDQNQSFPSGHVGVVAIGAGLTCAHHRYLRLYGEPWADAAACAAGFGTALATGVARIVNDRHYASDVLSSLLVGTWAGYAIPALLYYQAQPDRAQARPWMLLPVMTRTVIGLHWSQAL